MRTLVETRVLVGRARRLSAGDGPAERIQVPATVQASWPRASTGCRPRTSASSRRPRSSARTCRSRCSRRSPSCPRTALRRGLAHLQAAEFLYETSLFPDLEYTFKHALTHEVAYGSLLQERRRALHARIVDAIEALLPRPAGRARRAAGPPRRPGRGVGEGGRLPPAGRAQGGRALGATGRRSSWFEQALARLEHLPESPRTLEQAIDLRLELRHGADISSARSGRVARAPARGRGPRRAVWTIDAGWGRVCAFVTMHLRDARRARRGARGRHRARWRSPSASGMSRLQHARHELLSVQAHYDRGEYRRAVELPSGEPRDAAGRLGSRECFGTGRPAVGLRSRLAGRGPRRARPSSPRRADGEARRSGSPRPTQHALHIGCGRTSAAGRSTSLKGDLPTARHVLERGLRCSARNVVLQLPAAVASSAWALRAARRGERGA